VPGGIHCRIPRGIFGRRMRLEVEADLTRDSSRRDVVRATEGGEEVVERIVVREVDHFHTSAPLETVAMEDVVIAHREIEETSRLDAGWVFIIILRIWCRYLNESRAELQSRADTDYAARADRDARWVCGAWRRRVHAVASESGLKLLVSAQWYATHVGGHERDEPVCGRCPDAARASVKRFDPKARCGTGDEAAVISPAEAQPGPFLPRLIL